MKEDVVVVSYGARDAAMADALYRSSHDFRIHVADKHSNPLNYEIAERTGGTHVVVPDLNLFDIYDFAEHLTGEGKKPDFVLCGSEGPIIHGISDRIQNGLHIPVLAPTKKYAIEADKARQRELIERAAPQAGIRHKVFGIGASEKSVRDFMEKFGYKIAIKPVTPSEGKGVEVYGDHFNTPDGALRSFRERNRNGRVIVEERLVGEESSNTAFSDGIRLSFARDTRDYKRAFNDDMGPNTGGMGSYMDVNNWLPFMTKDNYDAECNIVQRFFDEMCKGARPEEIRGTIYTAFILTEDGPKIIEINSRPGDPEFMNILAALDTDFGEMCYLMAEENLMQIPTKPVASVVTYLVPQTYGGKNPKWQGDREVKLGPLKDVMLNGGENLRVYPGSMELGSDGKYYMMGSRTIALVGTGKTIEEARRRSVEAADKVEGDLWGRPDIASHNHIKRSEDKMRIPKMYFSF